MVDPVPCSPQSVSSSQTDKAPTPQRPTRNKVKDDRKDNDVRQEHVKHKPALSCIEPIEVDDIDMEDALDALLKDESLDEYIEKTDDLEQRCYAYMGSVIGTNDLLQRTMALYRGHTHFIVMSRHKDEMWIKGSITPKGFDLKFFRHSKKENKKVDGIYTELDQIFNEEALYRVTQALS